jgi:hypothetical protein
MSGYTNSHIGDVADGLHIRRLDDYWIVKATTTGILKWQKTIGSNGVNRANSIEQTPDGGYIVAGNAGSNSGDVLGFYGNSDFCFAKLSPKGAVQW